MKAVVSKLALLSIVMGLFACRRAEPQPVAATAPASAPGVVDSIFPVEEEIRRFKLARNHAPVTGLAGGAASRDDLVQGFMRALEANDTAVLRAMVLNAAEFIDVYYPTSIYARPPYRQSPELSWFLLQQNSEKGITRALRRYGGVPLGFQGYGCEPEPLVQESNALWTQCRVRWAPASGAPSPLQLFGPIIRHGGRFKFVSFANDF